MPVTLVLSVQGFRTLVASCLEALRGGVSLGVGGATRVIPPRRECATDGNQVLCLLVPLSFKDRNEGYGT